MMFYAPSPISACRFEEDKKYDLDVAGICAGREEEAEKNDFSKRAPSPK